MAIDEIKLEAFVISAHAVNVEIGMGDLLGDIR